MAAPITVSTSPVLISRTAAKPYLINNDGSVNVYLGQDTAVNPNNYAFILQPGQSLSWSEINKEVWAVTTTGTSKVSIAYEAAAVASSTVNISNATIPVTGTVNANITNASIPVSGNVGITSGSVSITSGTVNVGSGNVTAAVGNTPVLISTQTATLAGGTVTLPALAATDISAYSSIILKFVLTRTGGGATVQSLANGAYLNLITNQDYTTTFTAQPNYQQAQFTFPPATGSANTQSLQIPVLSKYLTVTSSVTQTASGFVTGSMSLEIYGSYETITAPRYKNLINIIGNTLSPAGLMYSALNSVAGNIVAEIPSVNGSATVTVASGSTTLTRCACQISAYYNGTSYFISDIALVAPGLTTVDYGEKANITFPCLPISLTYAQTGTTLSQRIAVIQ